MAGTSRIFRCLNHFDAKMKEKAMIDWIYIIYVILSFLFLKNTIKFILYYRKENRKINRNLGISYLVLFKLVIIVIVTKTMKL